MAPGAVTTIRQSLEKAESRQNPPPPHTPSGLDSRIPVQTLTLYFVHLSFRIFTNVLMTVFFKGSFFLYNLKNFKIERTSEV